MDYEEIMNMMLDELVQRCFQKQREEDPALDRLITRHIKIHGQLEEHLSELDEEFKKLFESYEKLSMEIENQQQNKLYLQGARDCILLLQTLGLL